MSRHTPWQLHPTLARDCHRLLQTPDVDLLLHRNASLHWFILVPHTDALDLLDLPDTPRTELLSLAAKVNAYLKQSLAYPRVNVGALGLLVPQLHLHLVGRRPDDPCWPAPVWGNLQGTAVYDEAALDQMRADLMASGCGNA